MHLEEGARTHFFAWLEREYPELVQGYQELYQGKNAPAAYTKEVARVLGDARAKAEKKRPWPVARGP